MAVSTDNGAEQIPFVYRIFGERRYMEVKGKDRTKRLSSDQNGTKTEVDGQQRTFPVSGVIDQAPNEILPAFDLWTQYSSMSIGVRPGEDKTIDGVACWQVVVSIPARFAAGRSMTFDTSVLLRKDNGQLRAVEHGILETPVYNPRILTRYVYDDFVTSFGIPTPTTVTRYISGATVAIYHISSVDQAKHFQSSDVSF